MTHSANPKAVFDDFELLFAIVEFLATAVMPATFLSEVLPTMELVVVARCHVYHTC